MIFMNYGSALIFETPTASAELWTPHSEIYPSTKRDSNVTISVVACMESKRIQIGKLLLPGFE